MVHVCGSHSNETWHNLRGRRTGEEGDMCIVEQHFQLRHDKAITLMGKKIKQRTHKYERVLETYTRKNQSQCYDNENTRN